LAYSEVGSSYRKSTSDPLLDAECEQPEVEMTLWPGGVRFRANVSNRALASSLLQPANAGSVATAARTRLVNSGHRLVHQVTKISAHAVASFAPLPLSHEKTPQFQAAGSFILSICWVAEHAARSCFRAICSLFCLSGFVEIDRNQPNTLRS